MFIYVIAEDATAGPCKIGYAADPAARLKQMQTGNPRSLVLIDWWWYANHQVAERVAHQRIGESRRLVGEWFDCTPAEAVAVIKSMVRRTPETDEIASMRA